MPHYPVVDHHHLYDHNLRPTIVFDFVNHVVYEHND